MPSNLPNIFTIFFWNFPQLNTFLRLSRPLFCGLLPRNAKSTIEYSIFSWVLNGNDCKNQSTFLECLFIYSLQIALSLLPCSSKLFRICYVYISNYFFLTAFPFSIFSVTLPLSSRQSSSIPSTLGLRTH